MKKSVMFGLVLSLFFCTSVSAQTKPAQGSLAFWNSLQKICGKAFVGTVAAAPADDVSFKDKELVMHVRACEKDRIRIPFFVGTDKSRT